MFTKTYIFARFAEKMDVKKGKIR